MATSRTPAAKKTAAKRSGNPATRATAKKVTSASEWRKSRIEGEELELPSGHVCRVTRPGLPELLAQGLMPDMLSPIAADAVEAGQQGITLTQEDAQAKFAELMSKPGGMEQMFEATDRIAEHVVIEPELRYHRVRDNDTSPWRLLPDGERDEEVLYTDEVDFQDKMFIFQYVVGGSRDLVQFRRELTAALGDLPAGS